MRTDKTIIGILGAAAIGATLGILFAPDKGTNTRKKIITKSANAKDKLREQLDNIKHSITEKSKSLLNKTAEFAENETSKIRIDNIKKINNVLEG